MGHPRIWKLLQQMLVEVPLPLGLVDPAGKAVVPTAARLVFLKVDASRRSQLVPFDHLVQRVRWMHLE